MRRGLLALLLILPGCGDRAAGPASGNQAAATPAPALASAEPDDGKAECAPRGAREFDRSCTIERSDGPNGRILTLRAPDGGFRRLLVTHDGRGVVAADGAEPARITILSRNRIEVAIDGDRFRLPASVKQP